MYLTKPAAVGIQLLGGGLLVAGVALTLYVYASGAAMLTAALGLGLILLGHPKRRANTEQHPSGLL